MKITINLSQMSNKELEQLYGLVDYEGNEKFFDQLEIEVTNRVKEGTLSIAYPRFSADAPTDWEIFVMDCGC